MKASRWLVGLWVALMSFGELGGASAVQAAPELRITQVAAFDDCGYVRGTVSGVAASGYRVAVLIYLPGAGWWSKPFCDPRVVTIGGDGRWSVDICTGGNDEKATMVEAYLLPVQAVATAYPSCVMGAGCVPQALKNAAVASDREIRPGQRKIRWSGREWYVKDSGGPVGPGGNYFWNATGVVWVDESDRLHLRIVKRDGKWYCPEIWSAERLGYGTYRFYADCRLDTLDRSIVLGLFTFSDFSCAHAAREVDIEFSRWGEPSGMNAQYVVQPHDVQGNRYRFTMTSAATSTHSFQWSPERLQFWSVQGHCKDPAQCTSIQDWTFAHEERIPPSQDGRVHLNMWLIDAAAPSNGQEAEVIISRFEFEPLRRAERPVYGISTASLRDPAAAAASAWADYRVWGRAVAEDADGLVIDDGCRGAAGEALPVRVLEPGHGYELADFVAAEGSLVPGSQPVLDTSSGRVELLD